MQNVCLSIAMGRMTAISITLGVKQTGIFSYVLGIDERKTSTTLSFVWCACVRVFVCTENSRDLQDQNTQLRKRGFGFENNCAIELVWITQLDHKLRSD